MTVKEQFYIRVQFPPSSKQISKKREQKDEVMYNTVPQPSRCFFSSAPFHHILHFLTLPSFTSL